MRGRGMTREEAIFCEKSYIGETNCTDCKYYGTETCQSRESHKMAVKALEQEPKTGHWIPHTDRGMIECSECHAEERTAHLLHSNFCPNCGTKMAENEE